MMSFDTSPDLCDLSPNLPSSNGWPQQTRKLGERMTLLCGNPKSVTPSESEVSQSVTRFFSGSFKFKFVFHPSPLPKRKHTTSLASDLSRQNRAIRIFFFTHPIVVAHLLPSLWI